MWTYPEIDPVALSLGPLTIHWYGLMYLAGFAFFWAVGRHKAKSTPYWTADHVSDFLFYGALGVILGGRLGYSLFYDFSHYLQHPIEIFYIWQGGMSFHGGLVGVSVAMIWFARKIKAPLFVVTDFVALLVPAGLFFGRMGNFINGELWGKVTDSEWGMRVYDPLLNQVVSKYPTQLLEALLEGVVLFTVLWFYARKPRPLGAVTGLFVGLYGSFRFFVEFYRMPDPQLGYLLWDWLTMGQVLSLPMILFGFGLWFWSVRDQSAQTQKGEKR